MNREQPNLQVKHAGDKTAETTDRLSKDTGGIVGLDRSSDSLDLTKLLAKEFEEKE